MSYPKNLILCLLFFTSCATLFNTKKTSVRIETAKGSKINGVETIISKNSDKYVLPRSAGDLTITVNDTSGNHRITMPAQRSFVYWENLLNLGLGFLVDKNTQKKYTYPRKLYIEKNHHLFRAVKQPTIYKGSVEFCITLPYLNAFYVKTVNDYVSKAGFMGIGAGLNFYYADNKYLALNAAACTDLIIPVPAPIRYGKNHLHIGINYLSLRLQEQTGRLSYGYGLSYSTTFWRSYRFVENESIYESQRNEGIGLSFNAQYNVIQMVSFGFIYQPTLYAIKPSGNFTYQHFMSIEATVVPHRRFKDSRQ